MRYESVFYAHWHKQGGTCRASNAIFPASQKQEDSLLLVFGYGKHRKVPYRLIRSRIHQKQKKGELSARGIFGA